MTAYRELDEYVKQARAFQMGDEAVRSQLLMAGWNLGDIEAALRTGPAELPRALVERKRSLPLIINPSAVVIASLLLVVAGLGGMLAFLWSDRLDLSETNNAVVRQFYARLSEGSVGFTDAGGMIFPDDKKLSDVRGLLIEQKKDFVEADLTAMELHLYRAGSLFKTFPILSKGKEGSWWETPTGSYEVVTKEQNHYSSIGEVWMPWSIQFYGNFFIHGWPYYEGGEAVPQGYSGGCIRLATEDAKTLYEFVDEHTAVLIREESAPQEFGTAVVQDAPAPSVSARSFLIANISTGRTLLGKFSDDVAPIASLTKLMTSVVASELVYLERSILVKNDSFAAAAIRFEPKVGDRYLAFDLLYPLLMQSSNHAAHILGGFLGRGKFVAAMNEKATSLGMVNSSFEDVSGAGSGNISSPEDMLKLLQYLYFKRHFLLEVSKGQTYQTYSGLHTTELENFNEFVGDSRLVGMKNGETSAAKQTLASVWEFSSPSGPVPFAIIVLGSDNREADTKTLLAWIEAHVEFK